MKTDDYCRFRICEDKPPEHLERQCDILTAVDMERYHTALEPIALHQVQQLCRQDRAGCTNGMAMRSNNMLGEKIDLKKLTEPQAEYELARKHSELQE